MGIFGWLKSRWQKAAPANPPQEPEPAKAEAPESVEDMRRIPEAHEVKAWPGEIPAPSFTRMDGGVILASTGCQSDVNVAAVRALFDAVEKRLRPPQQPILLVPELNGVLGLIVELRWPLPRPGDRRSQSAPRPRLGVPRPPASPRHDDLLRGAS